jgi:nucleotide-binding universal stress UspA family protein
MFKKIMTPVDLVHEGDMEKALQCAADLATLYKAEVTYVGVTPSAPGAAGHSPEEFETRLMKFAAAQGEVHGITTTGRMVVSHDPRADISHKLLEAQAEIGADLVVMASHAPGVLDRIWPSNGGKLAESAKCTVMVVRR